MAQQANTSFGTFIIPSAPVNIQVQQNNSGLATTGVIMIMGEASAGPDYTLEADITNNFFSPDALSAVIQKYQSGRIVDAFQAIAAASNDSNIQGSASRIYIAKTNPSSKASLSLARAGLSAYGTLADLSWGAGGNQLNSTVSASTPEVAPTTGLFTFVPSPQSATLAMRLNGAAKQTLAVSAKSAPATLVGTVYDSANTSLNSLQLSGLNDVLATGGVARNMLTGVSGNISAAASGNSLVITLSTGTWGTLPQVGDTLVIPDTGEYGAGTASVLMGPAATIATSPTGATNSGTVTTITTTGSHGFSSGQYVKVAGVGVSGYNGIWGPITVTGATTFTYAQVASLAGSGAGTAVNYNNPGAYVVTSANSSTVTATKLRNNNTTIGALAAPVAVTAAAIAATSDVQTWSAVNVQSATGVNRNALASGMLGNTVSGVASGSTLTLTLQTGVVWNALPQAGDLFLIPSTAPSGIQASSSNGGWYQVTSATSGVAAGQSTVTLTRLSNGNPASFAGTALVATSDLTCLRPVIDGVGKTLEVFDGAGTESVGLQLYTTSGALVTWLSTSTVPNLLTSASEYSATLTDVSSGQGISETVTAGGNVVLTLGYVGGGAVVTATATIANVSGVPTLTTTVSGGTGSNLSVNLARYKTLNDLAAYLNSQTGYVCAVANATFGQQLTTYTDNLGAIQTTLDKGTWGIASSLGAAPGRVKRDAWSLWTALSTNSIAVMLNPTAVLMGPPVSTAALAGLPEVQALTFMAGGARGGTSNANVVGALSALEKVQGNFLVPLFSQDSAADIALTFTDPSSSYTIDSINASSKNHVLALSQIKRRRNRQAFLSKRASFAQAQLAAQNIASARCAMTFQDYKETNIQGNLVQYQPWMGACLAAGMQAAGFYKPIVKKFMNTSGVVMNDGSYSDQLTGNVEAALLNGLLPAEKADTGGYRWVSDQTTYTVDSNFVYNSIQAVYVADTIALTLARRVENAFIGQSIADISAGVMVAYIQSVMKDFLRLKLIATSDDAKAGYKNLTVQISGPVAYVNIEVKLAGALYFAPINVLITQVQQAASITGA